MPDGGRRIVVGGGQGIVRGECPATAQVGGATAAAEHDGPANGTPEGGSRNAIGARVLTGGDEFGRSGRFGHKSGSVADVFSDAEGVVVAVGGVGGWHGSVEEGLVDEVEAGFDGGFLEGLLGDDVALEDVAEKFLVDVVGGLHANEGHDAAARATGVPGMIHMTLRHLVLVGRVHDDGVVDRFGPVFSKVGADVGGSEGLQNGDEFRLGLAGVDEEWEVFGLALDGLDKSAHAGAGFKDARAFGKVVDPARHAVGERFRRLEKVELLFVEPQGGCINDGAG